MSAALQIWDEDEHISQGRLKSPWNRTKYVYDQNSNRVLQTTPAGSVISTVDAQDKLLQMGSTVYSYDGNGELISKTDQSTSKTTQYAYDGLGELISVNLPNGNQISYTYDGMGNRVAKSVNGVLTQQFLYDETGALVASLDGSGNPINVYLYHKSVNSPDAIFHYSGPITSSQINNASVFEVIQDHLGSPKLIRNLADGSIQREMDFDEFGVVTNDTNPGLSDFGFAGCLYDSDTRLCHFGAREYDASTGRFTARDPIGFAGGSTNQYSYSLLDPVNFVDPSGTVGIFVGTGGATGVGGANGHGGVAEASGGFACGTTDSGGFAVGGFGATGTGTNISGAVTAAGPVYGVIFPGSTLNDFSGAGNSFTFVTPFGSVSIISNSSGSVIGLSIGKGGVGTGFGVYSTTTTTQFGGVGKNGTVSSGPLSP